MEVRTNKIYYRQLKKAGRYQENIPITLDDNVEIPIIMIQNEEKVLVEFLRGYKKVRAFLKYGYNRIIAKCPIRHRKCIGEKCSWYYVENLTGDCVKIWDLIKR